MVPRGGHTPQKTREKIRLSHIGLHHSEETKKKIGLAQIKQPYRSPDPSRRTRRSEATRQWRIRHPFRAWAHATLAFHKSRGYEISMSLMEAEMLASKTANCTFCDKELDYSQEGKNGAPHKDSPSLDRINNGIILSISNVTIVCHECNLIKRNRTMREFVEYCTRISERFQTCFPSTH